MQLFITYHKHVLKQIYTKRLSRQQSSIKSNLNQSQCHSIYRSRQVFWAFFLFKKYSYPGTQYQGGYQVIDTWEDILPYKACFMWKGPVSVHYLRVSHFCSHFWRISKEKFRRLGNFMWQKLHHLQAMYN